MHSPSAVHQSDVSLRVRKPNLVLTRVEAGLLWLCFTIAVGIAIWSAPRGFEFLDTGCYFLEIKYPDDVADTHTTYRLFARPFFQLVGESVTGFRLISWAVLWAAASFFAWSWHRFTGVLFASAGNKLSAAAIVPAIVLASCTVYTIKPAALTYNSLNFVGVCCAYGLLFLGATRLAQEDEQGWGGIALIAGAAGAATVDLLIKPTTAAFLLASIVGYCAVTPTFSRRTKVRLALVAAGGAVAALVAMSNLLGGVRALLVRAGTLTSILQNRAYMDELNTRTLREFGEIGSFLWADLRLVFFASCASAILLFVVRRSPVLQRRVATVTGAVVFGLWIYSTFEGKLWRGSHNLYVEGIVARLYLGASLVGALLLLLSFLVRRPPPAASAMAVSKLLVWLILMITPFAGAYGSTTTVYLNGALYAVCWLSALFLVLRELARIWDARAVLSAAVIPMGLYAVAQLFHGQIVMPYFSSEPLWNEVVPTRVGPGDHIVKVNPRTSECINRTREILQQHGFKQGDDIFCFFNVPGLVYAVGGRSPVIPWYFGRIYVGNGVEEFHMQAAGAERRAKAWIITQAEVTRFRDHFLRGGINFPEAYEEIGALKNPQSGLDLKIWKPRKAEL